jgi:glycosyltransferase involved in cell wall biosynthesis
VGRNVVALVPNADYLDSVETLGIEIRRFELARASLNPLRDLVSMWQIARHTRALRARATFGYSAKPFIYGALGARLGGARTVGSMVTGLGYAFSTDSRRSRVIRGVMVMLYRLAARASSVVFVQNPDDQALLRDFGVLDDRTRVVRTAGSGVNLKRFEPAPPVTVPVRFLMIGRMLEDKGVREFIDAARAVKREHPAVEFELVAPYDPSLPRRVPREVAQRAAGEGILEYVAGAPDVRPHLRCASVFVLPSYREGTPRSVLEAMAMARPVITSDAPGCRETVEPGRTGLLVPVGDVAALARAMVEFIEHPESIGTMGFAGRRLAEVRFDVRMVNTVIMQALGIDGAQDEVAG